MKRRTFGKEFKIEAVRLVQDRGVAVVSYTISWDVTRKPSPEGLHSEILRHNWI